MRRAKTRVAPGVEMAESRVLLSAAAPLLGPHQLGGIVHDVRAIMKTLARTGDTAQAGAQLTTLSSKVPGGPEQLAPAWRADLGLYRPDVAGSVGAVRRRIIGELDQYVHGGGKSGNTPVTGPSAPPAPPPAPLPAPAPPPVGSTTPPAAPSLDSVTVQNNTGLAIQVTIYLQVSQVQKPWITWNIPAQGATTRLFDFRSSTDAFMTMNVSRADGGQTPPPLNNLSLSQPMGGYNGTLFTISVFGSSFNVTPP